MATKNVNGSPDAASPEAPAEAATPEAEAPEAPEAASQPTPESPNHDVAQLRDRLLRQAAEFQNFRRRVERENATLRERGRLDVIEPMLGVLDDFRRSLDASAQAEQQEAPGPAYQALRDGLEMVYQNFSAALVKLGVEYIEAVGQPFDEREHEAVAQFPAPEGTAPGTVIEEVQRGYRLGDRVIRHSKVVVAA